MLGLLLWATPTVYSEVEGNTWQYLAVRPQGKISVLLGKYITAVGWTALAGWTGLTVSLLIAQPERGFHIWGVLAALVLLSSLSYGALFTFLGVVVHKRPMVTAVAYALILEFFVGMVPAMINQFTVQFRLRTLLLFWMDWSDSPPPEFMDIFAGTGPAAKHVLILLGLTVGLVAASAWILRQKTLVTPVDA
jgi:ABC-type transport system involved in multi-copper enzyme maturation permease subunit